MMRTTLQIIILSLILAVIGCNKKPQMGEPEVSSESNNQANSSDSDETAQDDLDKLSIEFCKEGNCR